MANRGKIGSRSRPKLLPGPSNWPLVGVMFSEDPDMDNWYKMGKEFGKILYYRLGSHAIIAVSSVEGAVEVRKTRDALFAHSPDKGFLRSAAKDLGFVASDTMFRSYNENQKSLKKLLNTNFFTASKLARFEDIWSREGTTMLNVQFVK
jgi:hypothetical protein